MSEQDLADYEPTIGEPICRPLRQYVLCVPPPPTSGVGLLQLMALLDGTDIDQRGPDDPQSWFLFAEASRIMYADRDRYVGDPRFVPVPVQRSEEHTCELQSLMRISNAVFCLKKT